MTIFVLHFTTVFVLHSLIQNRLDPYFSCACCVPCTVLDAGVQVYKTRRMLVFLERAFQWRAQEVDKPHGTATSRGVVSVPKENNEAL